MSKELRNLFNKYNCDKSKRHSYEKIYGEYFEPLREQPINILEIGVFKAESTNALLEYFPNAQVYGIDIFTRVALKDLTKWYDEKRVHLLQCDSTKMSTRTLIQNTWKGVEFDIIIDDGAHWPKANMDTFNMAFPLLKSGCDYFIEDVWPLDIMTDEEWTHSWMTKNPTKYTKMDHLLFMTAVETHPSTKKFIQRDNRSISGTPDSYIYVVQSK